MSAPASPRASSLPGIAHLKPQINLRTLSGSFADADGCVRTFKAFGGFELDAPFLTVQVDDGSMASFERCPPPDQDLWYATGLTVVATGKGIASHIYAIARDILSTVNAGITPSGNLFGDGVKLWGTLDPTMTFEEREELPGYYRMSGS